MTDVVPNARGIVSGRVAITAANTIQWLPNISVPDDMALALKAGPANAGLIQVGAAGPDILNPNLVWPLLPNEAVAYRVKNAASIYFSGTVAGDFIYYTVEQVR